MGCWLAGETEDTDFCLLIFEECQVTACKECFLHTQFLRSEPCLVDCFAQLLTSEASLQIKESSTSVVVHRDRNAGLACRNVEYALDAVYKNSLWHLPRSI